eukprot:GEMP01057133.1.p1 GENE.GEMP01057133.1~~GEMP01057133.1.p1  ORF type:complete len:264 (+),score=67.97 GEMP01057133.1:177-968(+)
MKFLNDNHVPKRKLLGTLISSAISLSDAVHNADFVFEAVVENEQVKSDVFQALEAHCTRDAVLCSNTSSLSITEITKNCATRDRMIATHFIGPAHLMPMVEVAPGEHSDSLYVDRAYTFLQHCGKRPIKMKKEIEGFINARLQAALYREAMHIVLEGAADPATVDAAVVDGFGRRLNTIGPFAVADFVGVDLVQKTHRRLFPQLGNQQEDVLADELAAKALSGVKSGKGHVEWPEERAATVFQKRDDELLRRLRMDFENRDGY